LSYPSNITYQDNGSKIIVDSIDPIYKGTISNFIRIKLEKKVPYRITLTPNCEDF